MDNRKPRHCGQALCASLSNNHGAAFLLAVYFSALVLLLLGGVSLQRTNTEWQAAQTYRDVQQAFWFSEAALDRAQVDSRSRSFDHLTTYPVASMPSRSSFTLTPVRAEIFNNNVGAHGRVHAHVMNPYQRVTMRITGTGVSESNRASQSASAYVVETGPLRGVWANGTIAIGGGRNVDKKIFLAGDLYSGLGSVTSEIVDESGLFDLITFDGIINVPGGTTSPQAQLDYWSQMASDDLKGIKDGYRLINLLREDARAGGASYGPPLKFVTGVGATTSDHVDGAMAVGLMDTHGVFDSRQCSATLRLTSSTVLVPNRFSCDQKDRKNDKDTPGLDCDKKVTDRENERDKILMCVKALVPDSEQAWLDAMTGNPPHVIFEQPATVIVTGSTPIDVMGTVVQVPILGLKQITPNFAQTFGLKTDWNVTIGAKISGRDAYGQTTPVEIIQADAAKSRPKDASPHGMVFVTPGDKFAGSIYAPESLIVMRARHCAPNCPADTLQMQYVVGNEVVIELEGDELQLGSEEDNTGDVTTGFLSWTAR